MCTLFVVAGVVPGYPLVVVANRDERLGRPASPPRIWPGGFLAPRDEVAHGTWLGVNPHGVFVGITNRYLGPQDTSRVSRGAIVAEALAEPSAQAIHAKMAKVRARTHNGFHLVYADGRDVLATISDGEHIARLSLGNGLHAVTERSFGAGDDSARVKRVFAAWSRLARIPLAGDKTPFDVDALGGVLAEHDPNDRLGSTCIHLEGIDYGTRSGMVLALGDDPSKNKMLWAEGPPCTTPFVPVAVPEIRKTG
ncbi:hypothetical protein AKJ09_02526 [Labilithrix luteola]|uniref:NRDE family protein n=1 Tax=Labilithrix luteola TaxID=1391654 RepID=A0A0K1PQQ8_9BACT|nr:NRDE family protein [Labilithrix luteola]AKU95862.1 hypothetical protein AKJ09_02526 [Labilithrix luteola]